MSSKAEQQVDIVSDDGHKKMWYQGHFYRKEGNKYIFDFKHARLYIVGFTLILCVGIFFKESEEINIDAISSISTPDRISGYQNQIVLNEYSDTKELKNDSTRTRRKIEKLSLVSRSKKVEIPLGSQARGVLVTGGTNGPIKVKLLEDLEFHGEVYIKEGAVLWGRGSSTQERLLISFTRYVDENGQSKEINANAFDISDQILGLKGSIIGRTSKKLFAGAGLGVAGALKTMQESENLGGVAVVKPNLENALLNGASSAALGIAEQELEELKNKQTVIEVKKGTQLMIVFGGM